MKLLIVLIAGIAGLGGIASAQWNIDLDLGGTGRWSGGPDAGFSGAANMPGLWEVVEDSPRHETPIRNIYGAFTGATIMASGGVGGGYAYGNPQLDDNFVRLLGDGGLIGDGGNTYTFGGLPDGLMEVYTYSVDPTAKRATNTVTVSNSITDNPQICTGPLPINQLVEGLTHTQHLARVVGHMLVIHVDTDRNWGIVNGFQLKPGVPEPSAMLGLTTGLLALSLRTRKPRRNQPSEAEVYGI